MRIVQAVGWFYPDSVGGTENYVAALGRSLRDAGYDVLIAAPRPGAPAGVKYVHDGFEVFRYPVAAAPNRDEAQGRVAVRGTDAFRDWLAGVRPDVVHMHTFVTGLGLDELAAAKALQARVIVTNHSSSLGFLCQRGTLMRNGDSLCDGRVIEQRCAACSLQQRGVPLPVASALSRIPSAVSRTAGTIPGRAGTALGMRALISWNRARQARMFDCVDRFVVLTDRAASIVAANGAPTGKLAVNRLGVARGFAPPHSDARAPRSPVRVGYVGRLDPVKGVLDLAAAVRMLPRDLPIEIEFRGPMASADERRVAAQIRRASGEDRRVRLESAVAPAGVPAVLAALDVACFPSRCLEGGPTAGLEALAVGTPVIAAGAGGLAEILSDGVNSRFVSPGDVRGLAAALTEVASNPAMIGRWRSRLPRVRSMDDVAADYITEYARRGC